MATDKAQEFVDLLTDLAGAKTDLTLAQHTPDWCGLAELDRLIKIQEQLLTVLTDAVREATNV
jgi:hypothetical protein